MTRFCAALAAAAALGLPAPGDDKQDPKKDPPVKGAWVREADGGLQLTFDFRTKDKLVVTVDAGDSGVTLTCKYEADKDGKVKAEVTEVKEKGEFPSKPPVGYEFKLVFKVDKDDKDKAAVSDFEGENSDHARQAVEGEYKRKKGD